MSIAVTAVVRPSWILRAMVGAISTLVVIIAVLVASGAIGNLILPQRLTLGCASFFLAVFGFYHGVCQRKTIQLYISGTGLIHITEIDSGRTCMPTKRPHVKNSGETVKLLNGSTIWPHLLLLLLRSANGRVIILPILPDCLSPESFKAVSVACRWISNQNDLSS